MTRLPRLSPIETLILEMLIEHAEMYGLAMVEASNGELKRGTVYVTLDRMEDRGLLESFEADGKGRGPARRMYRPTGLGMRTLAAWEAAGAVFAGH